MKKAPVLMCGVLMSAMLTACSSIDNDADNSLSNGSAASLESVDSLNANNSENSTYISGNESNSVSDESHNVSTTVSTLITTISETVPVATTTPSHSNTSSVSEQLTSNVTPQYAVSTTTSEIKSTQDSQSQTTITEITMSLDKDIQLSEDEKEIIELVNLERSKNGLQPLTASDEISAIARKRAEEIVELFSDEHTRPDGRGFDSILADYGMKYSYIGENIAKGCSSPDDVMNEWLNSPSHRENILNSNYQNIGVAKYEYENEVYWVQFFYSPYE